LLLSSAENGCFSEDEDIKSDSAVVDPFLLDRMNLNTGDLNRRKEECFLRAETLCVSDELGSTDVFMRLSEDAFLKFGGESGMLSTGELIICNDCDFSTRVGPCALFLDY